MIDPRTPVLVGVGQTVDRDSAAGAGLSPADLLAKAAKAALADCGAAGVAAAVESVTAIRLFADSSPAFASPFGGYANLPASISRRIGAVPRETLYPPVGGNTPQMMVNLLAERIAGGELEVALIAGGEAIRTQSRAVKAGVVLDWAEDAESAPDPVAPETAMVSKHEVIHGIALPVNVYPLFENALGTYYGQSAVAHRLAVGRLMEGFAAVAARNPYAALPVARSAAELITPDGDNRYIGYPYTKYLNSNMFVDQAAAVVMMSAAAADRLGVPPEKRVYLHGSADTHEHILVSKRVNYHSSPAIRAGAAHALAQAGTSAAGIDHIELYSCFSSAVEIAADAIGFAHDDPRGLTLTGGLPYFGGPGNAYSVHGIAECVAKCREKPGSRAFLFANGGYLTKHSFGVYSSTPGYNGRSDPATYQAAIDAMPAPRLVEKPEGQGTVETFTVIHHKGEPAFAIIIGRLDDGSRFLSQMHAGLDALIDQPVIGRRIAVAPTETVNLSRFV